MESTGEGGKVQISEATQQALMRRGYSGLIVEREEKVFAKGKGEMKTFWLIGPNRSRQTKFGRLDSQSSSEGTIAIDAHDVEARLS